jgi:very-short-patch-repair endonuclease
VRDSEAWSVKIAKHLRRAMTDAEVILWSRLRRNVIPGIRFRRQHPIGPYIADFVCVLAKLVVEVDRGPHSSDAEVLHDRRRTAYPTRRSWRIFRATNEDVYKNLDVLDGIVRFAPPPALRDTSPADAGEEEERVFPPPVAGEVVSEANRRGRERQRKTQQSK